MVIQSKSSKSLFLLNSLEDHQTYILALLSKGRHTVFIYNSELNPLLFEQTEVIEQLSNIARSTAASDIRIIIGNPQSLVDNNPRLLALAHRLPSKISIQKLTINPPNNAAFMLVDANKIWLQHNNRVIAGENTGFANLDARAEVKNHKETFKNLWRYSEQDVRLRELSHL